MSIEEIKRFNDDAANKSELQEGMKGFGTDLDALIAFANDKGYDFSKEELLEFAKNKQGELSEDELDKVAGGAQIEVVLGPATIVTSIVTVDQSQYAVVVAVVS